MRQLISLVLIATGALVLFQNGTGFVDTNMTTAFQVFSSSIDNPDFLLPLIAAILTIVGGVTLFLGGNGGATFAFCGGVLACGVGLASGQTFDIASTTLWSDELTLGALTIFMAGISTAFRPAYG